MVVVMKNRKFSLAGAESQARSGFFRFLQWFNDYIRKSERRKKVFMYLCVFVLIVEVGIHKMAVIHFTELRDWTEGFPIAGPIIQGVANSMVQIWHYIGGH